MSKQIQVNFSRCTYCRACEAACQVENRGRSFVRVHRINDLFAAPLLCRRCDPAPCALSCPTRALSLEEGDLTFTPETCTGCGLCLTACPFGMISYNAEARSAALCTLCAPRLARGLAPACVLTCPTAALSYGDLDVHTVAMRRRVGGRIGGVRR